MVSSTSSFIGKYFALRQMGNDDQASRLLGESSANLLDEWPRAIHEFLRNQAQESDVLDLAERKGKQTEAHCYMGLEYFFSGQTEMANEHLRWVQDNGDRGQLEYGIARAILARLKGMFP